MLTVEKARCKVKDRRRRLRQQLREALVRAREFSRDRSERGRIMARNYTHYVLWLRNKLAKPTRVGKIVRFRRAA